MHLIELFSFFALLHEIWKAAALFMPAGLVFVPHISWLTCGPGQRPPGISSSRPSTLQSLPSCLLHMVTLSLFLSAFAPQHSFIFSDGEGHRKAIPLSLDVCFRCPFRDIWTAPCWRACVHISSTRRKTKKLTFFCDVQWAC